MMKELLMKGSKRSVAVLVMLLTSTIVLWAQQTIKLQTANQQQSADKAVCVKSDMQSLKATFSFSSIEAKDYKSKEGDFSVLSLSNTVVGGNEGEPQLPVINKLISVPVGAKPRIEIKRCKVMDYNLKDYDIKTLMPRQPSLRKDKNADDVPFVFNKVAYQKSGLGAEPKAVVEVVGTMRGIRLAKMTIEPVSYDPVNNTLRVFNDIDVEVHFDGADAKASQDLFAETYSPYFNTAYSQLFNSSAVKNGMKDAYTAHPDLYTTPVKMLVVTTQKYTSCPAFSEWLKWKKQKGIAVDVKTVTSNTSAAEIRQQIINYYNAQHPTFLVIIGDKEDVTNYKMYDYGSNYGDLVSDNEYASVDNDIYHDMFMSRMCVSTTQEFTNLVNKTLNYEKYTMADMSYLDHSLLIAGWDSNWTNKVGKPTIEYAEANYYNEEHGITPHVFITTGAYQRGCYDYINSVGFVNYTAHGDINMLADPEFRTTHAAQMTNDGKPLWVVANCCLSANWGYSSDRIPISLGEAMIRLADKGAFGYIGSIPESYWYEDYYFGVGAFPYVESVLQTTSSTTMGMYDALFDDNSFNTLNSVPFIGNVAVTQAHASGYTSAVTDEYYWRAYQCLGDGSVMPYLKAPAANNVVHDDAVVIGVPTFTVSADPGSYVSITKDDVILGVAVVGSTGAVNVPLAPITDTGDVMIVVTRNQRQPYISTIPAIAPEGAYITLDNYTPVPAHVGDVTSLSLDFKNVGIDAATGTTTVILSSNNDNVTITQESCTFDNLASDATVTASGFQFSIAEGVADGTVLSLHYTATNGENTWEGDFNITAAEAVLEYQNMVWDGSFVPGETLTVNVKFKNTGHFQATNASVTVSSASEFLSFAEPTVEVGTIAVGEEVTCQFSITIADNCLESEHLPLTFTMTAEGGLSAQGEATLKNTCFVYLNLADSYGDGWNDAKLTVSFDDGTPSQEFTLAKDTSSAQHALEIGNGTHVTLTWTKGSYDSECSFTVSYGEGMVFYQMAAQSNPASGLLYEFDCNCAAATQTFTVTATTDDAEHGTVSGGGEFGFGQSCTVTATPAQDYMFSGWTVNGELVSTSLEYTFNVIDDMELVANFEPGTMIGNGSSTNDENLPSNSYYNYTLSEQIYTAAELGRASTITGIAFYNGGTEQTRSYDFYIKTTTKSNFSNANDWIAVSASDKVFSGTVTMVANDWTHITFDTPFFYDGNSNIVLVTDDNTGSWQSGMKCTVFGTASSQAIYIRNDQTDFAPASPSSYSGTLLNSKNQLVVTKEDAPTGPFYVTVGVTPADASTVTGDGEFNYGETATVTVEPNDGYIFVGWAENGQIVSSDLEYSFTVTSDRDLVATFTEGFLIGDGSTDKNSKELPSNGYYKYGLTEQIYTADEIGTAGTITSIALFNSGAQQIRKYDLYLTTTEKSSFSNAKDWVPVTTADKVFSGNVTFSANDWTFIYFNTPFEYDGTSNLLIAFDDNTGQYSKNQIICRTYTTKDESHQSMYVRNDQTNYNPATPTSYSGYVLTEKNQLILGITTKPTLELANNGDNSEAISMAAENGKKYDVTLTGRTLYKDGTWNTLCLPFDVTIAGSALDGTGVEAKTIASASITNNKLKLKFGNAVNTLEAGVPYIIRWENDTDAPTIFEPKFENVTLNSTHNNYDKGTGDQRIRFIGIYNLISFETEDRSILFMGDNNKLYWPLPNASVGAQRAYFKIGDDDAVGSRKLVEYDIDFGDASGVTTGIFAIDNGRLAIEDENSDWYTVDGRKLDAKPVRKGVYVRNGLKVVIK